MSESKGVTVFSTPNTAPKLTKSNYGEWVVHMGILIRSRNRPLWKYLDDKGDKPTIPLTRDENLDISDLIYPMLSAEARQMLLKTEYEDGVELWQEIKKIFTISGKRQYIKLQREQNELQYSDFDSVHAYRATWMRLQTAIKGTGVQETEDNKFFINLLQALPKDKFGTITSIWNTTDLDTITGDKAVQMVAEEEMKIAAENQEPKSQNEAYMTVKRSIPTCKHCKKRGHTIERCFQLKPEIRPSWWVDRGHEKDTEEETIAF
jgi:hypothetical protein